MRTTVCMRLHKFIPWRVLQRDQATPAERTSKAPLSSSSRCPVREDRLHAADIWPPTFPEKPSTFVVAIRTGPQKHFWSDQVLMLHFYLGLVFQTDTIF